MASSGEFLVSKSGQMSVPADVRRRWGLTDGGRVAVVDLGDAGGAPPARRPRQAARKGAFGRGTSPLRRRARRPGLGDDVVAAVVIDDHLLRDVLAGERPADLGGLASALATTGLWLFRLSRAWAAPDRVGKLTAPVAALPAEQQARFLHQLVALPPEIEVLNLRDLAWPMAQLQHRHRLTAGSSRPPWSKRSPRT